MAALYFSCGYNYLKAYIAAKVPLVHLKLEDILIVREKLECKVRKHMTNEISIVE